MGLATISKAAFADERGESFVDDQGKNFVDEQDKAFVDEHALPRVRNSNPILIFMAFDFL